WATFQVAGAGGAGGTSQLVCDLVGLVSRPGQLRQSRSSRKIVNAGLGIHYIERLPEVALGEQIAAKTANVGQLHRKLLGQFTAYRKIRRIGIRGLEG